MQTGISHKMSPKYFLLVGIIAISLGLTACKPTQNDANAAETQAAPHYDIIVVSKSDRELHNSYSAIIRGRQDIEIYPQISGILAELCVQEGQAVQQGQTLFIIDQKPYQIALTQTLAGVQSAQAALSTAKLAYNGRLELYQEKVISSFELQAYKNDLLNAEAALAQAQANELKAQNDLSYTVITSPSNGVVGVLPYRRGTLVSSDMAAPLTTISDNSDIYVYFSMDETQILSLMRQYGSIDSALGNMENVRLVLSDSSVYGEIGKIESVSGVIDTNTGSVSLRAKFPNPQRLLFSGATGVIQLPVTYANCLVIPQAATVRLQDKYLVYKVVDGKAVSTLISVSPINDGQEYIVLSGLNEGNEIVAAGAGFVQEGMTINR